MKISYTNLDADLKSNDLVKSIAELVKTERVLEIIQADSLHRITRSYNKKMKNLSKISELEKKTRSELSRLQKSISEQKTKNSMEKQKLIQELA